MKTIFVRPCKIRIFLVNGETLILGKVLKVGVQKISGKIIYCSQIYTTSLKILSK